MSQKKRKDQEKDLFMFIVICHWATSQMLLLLLYFLLFTAETTAVRSAQREIQCSCADRGEPWPGQLQDLSLCWQPWAGASSLKVSKLSSLL
jgi:hypothetical protein